MKKTCSSEARIVKLDQINLLFTIGLVVIQTLQMPLYTTVLAAFIVLFTRWDASLTLNYCL